MEVIKDGLEVAPEEAEAVLRVLVTEGFVVEAPPLLRDSACSYQLTVKGAALAQASAAKPLLRSTVELKLAELIERMTLVNASSDYLYGVEEAFVYGSYLGSNERLGDDPSVPRRPIFLRRRAVAMKVQPPPILPAKRRRNAGAAASRGL